MRAGALEVVAAGPESAAMLAVLQADWWREADWVERPWGLAAWHGVLAMPGCRALIAARADEPVGFACTRTAADEAELLLIAVAPDARRAGVGRALLGAAMAQARQDGAARFFLEVAEPNRPAIGLYRAAGFSSVGRRADYYDFPNCRAAAKIMSRPLTI